jgi:hypothetical protein
VATTAPEHAVYGADDGAEAADENGCSEVSEESAINLDAAMFAMKIYKCYKKEIIYVF